MIYSKSVLFSSVIFLFSCGDSSDDVPECGPSASCDPSEVLADSSVFEGSWSRACYLATDLPPEMGDIYEKISFTFSGSSTGSFSSTYSAHRSEGCDDSPMPNNSGTRTGTYKIGNEYVSDEGLTVTELDFMLNEITFLNGQSVSPILDQSLVLTLTLAYIDTTTMYFGIDDGADIEPPVRHTAVDFDKPFVKQ